MRRITARHQVYVARVGFFLCGFAVACWAPLIPIIQQVLSLTTAEVSAMVFAFGLGSILGMVLSGILIEHIGFKATYTIMSLTVSVAICVVAFMPSFEVVLVSLVIFGCSYSCLEVALNVYASYLEKHFKLMLLSVLYAYFSFGEVIGALLMIFLLTMAIPPSLSIAVMISMLYVASAYYIPVIISIKSENKQENRAFSRPRQPVISLGLIVAFTYIVGGAILDWSGLYVTQEADIPLNYATYGYCIMAFCMLICRIYAKPILSRLGAIRTALGGALLMAAGLVVLVAFPYTITMTIGFFAIGIGMSNITPLATSAAGQQHNMPMVSAVAFVSILGYTGLLLGPAVLGLIANVLSLKAIFLFLGFMTLFSAYLIFTCRAHINAIDRTK